jgi:hypothetical protein
MNCMRGLVFALETCLRLGLLLQSGAPFDRSSKSWFILVRIVGPDRGHRRTSDITVKCGGCMAHILAFHHGRLTQQPRRPSSTVGRPPCLRSIIPGRDLPFAHFTSFGRPCPAALFDLRP